MWIAAAAVVVAAGCGHAPAPPLADSPEWAEAHRKAAFRDSGENLGRAQAEQVTAHLEEAPDDLAGREKLLYFYAANGTRFYDPAVVAAARRKHILWLIEHHPEDPILAQPAGVLRAVDDPAGLAQAKKLWQAKGDAPHAAAWLRMAEPSTLEGAAREQLSRTSSSRGACRPVCPPITYTGRDREAPFGRTRVRWLVRPHPVAHGGDIVPNLAGIRSRQGSPILHLLPHAHADGSQRRHAIIASITR